MAVDDYKLVSEPTHEQLNDKEIIDYRTKRKQRVKWYENLGKDPVRARGYSETTVTGRLGYIDRFARSIWNDGGYTTTFTHEDANEFVQESIYKDITDESRTNMQKALKMYFKYRAFGGGMELQDESLLWNPTVTFQPHSSTTVSREYFTPEELRDVRTTALSYGSPPHYCALSPEERTEWKIHLAQRYEIPKEEVGPDVFDRADGYKIASLICVSVDTGLRPVEIGRATTEWVNVDQQTLTIPKDRATKNTDVWDVALTDSTTEILQLWLEERKLYEKYDNTDVLWLTKYNNPYNSQTLARLLRRVCEETDVDHEKPTWYYIRRGVASRLCRKADIHTAQMQLRHKSPQTTLRYVQTTTDEQRDALENSL